MEVERGLGFEPTDREFEKLGYDIESRIPGTGRLRFIEVKGRRADAPTVTVTKNGHTWRWRNLQKWSRTYTRYGIWTLTPNTRDRTVNVRVATNGRCVVGVGVK